MQSIGNLPRPYQKKGAFFETFKTAKKMNLLDFHTSKTKTESHKNTEFLQKNTSKKILDGVLSRVEFTETSEIKAVYPYKTCFDTYKQGTEKNGEKTTVTKDITFFENDIFVIVIAKRIETYTEKTNFKFSDYRSLFDSYNNCESRYDSCRSINEHTYYDISNLCNGHEIKLIGGINNQITANDLLGIALIKNKKLAAEYFLSTMFKNGICCPKNEFDFRLLVAMKANDLIVKTIFSFDETAKIFDLTVLNLAEQNSLLFEEVFNKTGLSNLMDSYYNIDLRIFKSSPLKAKYVEFLEFVKKYKLKGSSLKVAKNEFYSNNRLKSS